VDVLAISVVVSASSGWALTCSPFNQKSDDQ
jgi:hypothetical protein